MAISKELRKQLRRSVRETGRPIIEETDVGGSREAAARGDSGVTSGGVVRVARLQRGLTLTEAAQFVGVTERTFWRWEQEGPSRLGKMLLREEGWL